MPVADAFMVRSVADDESADVAAGHAETEGRAAWRLDLLGGGQRQPPDGVADRAERRHRVDQSGPVSAGQRGKARQPLGGPVANTVVVTAVLSRRGDQGREVPDGEMVGVGEPVQIRADRLAVNGRWRERQGPQPGGGL